MNEMLGQIIAYINQLSGGNQFIGGILTASLTTGIMWLLKDLPRKFFVLVKEQFTTELVLNNASWEKEKTFVSISKYIEERSIRAFTRQLIVESVWSREKSCPDLRVTIGFGWHMFRYRGRFMFVHRQEHPNNQGETIKEIMRIVAIGRDHDIMNRLVDDNRPKDERGVSMMTLNTEYEWVTKSKLVGGGLDTIALDPTLKAEVRRLVGSMLDARDEHLRIGIAHKLTILLHGTPGSGKTSLVRAIACEFRLNICMLNVAACSDEKLIGAVTNLPRRSILLMEDFDSASSVVVKDDEKEGGMASLLAMGSRSGFLNALDGIVGLDEVIVVMTTNFIDQIDSAIKRSGRCDLIMELPPVSALAIEDHFTTLFPALAERELKWDTLPGCVIHKIKQSSIGDIDKLATMLQYYFDHPEEAAAEQAGQVEHLKRVESIMLAPKVEAKSEKLEEIQPTLERVA